MQDLEGSLEGDGLDKTWKAIGVDPAKLERDARGTIQPSTLPPLDIFGPRANVTLPRIAVEGIDRATPDLRLGPTLGEGGASVVKQATQIPLWREVAVKILRNSRSQGLAALELLREALIMSTLEHPNILPIHSLGCDGEGSPMLVMRRVQGVAWSQLLVDPAHPMWKSYAETDRFDFHLDVLLQVCNGISYAHSRGIVHRDLKPENVMIGEFGEVYVLDWGIAITTRDEPTGLLPKNSEIRHIAGTPENMAPEMANGDGAHITEKTDVYLLGAMLHRCLTGKPRHQGETIFDLLRAAHASETVKYPASVPPELAAICNKATDVDPEKRFQSAEEFRQAVVDFRRHQSSAALGREALQRLQMLKDALRSPGADNANLIHRLFDECRFGFQQALKTWPSNMEASKGLNEAIEIMARREIARKDAQAAAVLIAEMTPPPQSSCKASRTWKNDWNRTSRRWLGSGK